MFERNCVEFIHIMSDISMIILACIIGITFGRWESKSERKFLSELRKLKNKDEKE